LRTFDNFLFIEVEEGLISEFLSLVSYHFTPVSLAGDGKRWDKEWESEKRARGVMFVWWQIRANMWG